jgi:hypothetical protein
MITTKITATKPKKVKTLNLPKRLFWDVDYDKIDWDDKWFWVIERVIQRGDMADFSQIFHYYGRVKVKQIYKESRRLSPRQYSFGKIYFNLTDQDLCITTQSYPKLWIY